MQNNCLEIVKNLSRIHGVELAKAMPNAGNYDRLCRSAFHLIATKPDISQCDPASIFIALSKVAITGLELGEGIHIVSFFNNKKNIKEAKVMYDYKGLIELCMRTGKIKSMCARTVYKNDEFFVVHGSKPEIVHNPDVFGDRGSIIGYYAIVLYTSGGYDFETMSVSEVDRIRKIAKTDSIWSKHLEEMSKKTVLKKLIKRVEKCVEIVDAVKDDNAISVGNMSVAAPLLIVPKIEQKQDTSLSLNASPSSMSEPPATFYNEVDVK
ncbi:MAG: hypothetical protein DRQ41_15410 [Gammaproteobacteria bacterium]|nr:MAG: hypothetical protein DRQ41_15410 [Gammaproteobacteria bacterium]